MPVTRGAGRYLLDGLLPLILLVTAGLFLSRGLIWAAAAQVAALLLVVWMGWRFYRDRSAAREHGQVLLKVSRDLSSKLELGDLLDYTVQSILHLVPLAGKCVIHLLDERGRRLYPRYSSRPDWERTLGMPADRGIAGQALRELRTVVVADVHRESEFLPLHSGSELCSLMVAPLYAQGKPLGTISLNSSVRSAFSKQDELLVTALAAQASVGINLSQLYAAALGETQHIEAIINNLSDGLAVLDAEGCLVRYNPSLAYLLGAETPSIVGQRVSVDADDERLRRLAHILGDCQQPAQSRCERQVEVSDPVRAVLSVSAVPVPDHDGHWGHIVVVHDQTAELERIRVTSSLLAAASQEIQTPLGAIRGYVTLLLSKDSADRALLCLTREQVARLTRLAEDLADVCALDRHALQSKAEPVTISDLLADMAAALSAAAERQRVSIDMQSPPNLIGLPLDGERVRRVCLNLLQHALDRSSPGGWISLRVEATLEEITVTLADNGRPMPAEVWARVTGHLGHSDGSLPHDRWGAGLGLYMSRRIVEAQGGQLWMLESTEGVRLQFTLPLRS